MPTDVAKYQSRLEELAVNMGLDYYPVTFELVPPSFMTEVAVYGLPVRMPHWSFGVRYIHQLVQHRLGHSRLFEVVFPGDPGRAYLANTNSAAENTLVCAHVLGHADFAKHNALFRRSRTQVGHRIVELAAGHARRMEQAIEAHGQPRVERVLDAALALEPHIDVNLDLNRPPYTAARCDEPPKPMDRFQARFEGLAGEESAAPTEATARARPRIPPRPEYDLLWFIARYAPEMADWERDLFLAVREESFYFYPLFACHIMNEGWACYWHARLLREASFLPDDFYVDAMKAHSDVVRPVAGDDQVALSINPYHLGFTVWDRIVEKHGVEAARRIMCEEDDFGFIRNHVDAELIEALGLFVYDAQRNGAIKVVDRDIHRVHEALLAPRFNFGAPRVRVSALRQDGGLVLEHEHAIDGRGLDVDRARKVMEYMHRVWRRPVILNTVDASGAETLLSVGNGIA